MRLLPYLSLTAVYLGLVAPSLGKDNAKAKFPLALADKATCESTTVPGELGRKGLTCLRDLSTIIQRYDGRTDSSDEITGQKDNRLSTFEFTAGTVSTILLMSNSNQTDLPAAYWDSLANTVINDFFRPADINRDCYLSPADDVYPVGKPDNMITLEDLTRYRTTATSIHSKAKCSYELQDPKAELKKKK